MALRIVFIMLLALAAHCAPAQKIIPGAESVSEYLPLLKEKRVALVVNQTSVIGKRHLADSLLSAGIHIAKIFAPEHGFRGQADAGAHVANSRDSITGLPIVSLYGKQQKPTAEMLADVDAVIYDIQDVGVRFYTYISTLQNVMEACTEQGKKLIILDRPDPNGSYVDGPVLDTGFRSFIGMQPVPVVYGLTPGEYAQMLVGEHWFKNAERLKLEVIKCKGYDHNSEYRLPVAPSPNLRTMEAVYMYPSVCLFEGTVVSVGRGTDRPFEQWGHPALKGIMKENFRPESTAGAADPPLKGQVCYGHTVYKKEVQTARKGIQIQFLVEMYKLFPEKEKFFIPFFEKLAGNSLLRKQITSGMTADEIRASWQPGLAAYKAIRKKYLLYKDFE